MWKISFLRIAKNHAVSKLNYCTAKSLETTASNSTNTPKTTFLQKWISYWKVLLNDYKDVIVEAAKHSKDHPLKSAIWLSIFCSAYACGVMNPDENNFRASIINRANDLIFVGKSIRNPVTEQHLKNVESYYNSGQIRCISLGVFSIILRDFKTRTSGIYKDNCSYTQPTYLDIIRNNVVDVGFLNKWWILESKMVDYDVNETEWK